MNIWSPLIGEKLKCQREPTNVEDRNAVAIIKIDSMGEEFIVGHTPKNICKSVSLFLTLPNCSMEAEVIGKRVNCGGGNQLEIPVQHHFLGPAKAIDWLEKKLEGIVK